MKRITAIILMLSLFLLQIPVFADDTVQLQSKPVPDELKKAVAAFDYINVLENDFNIEKAMTDYPYIY